MTGGLRYKLCALCGDMHDVHDWPDNHVQPLAAPMVIRDDMSPVQSMLDGKLYDSKRALRATYRPSGNREGKYFTEVGDDKSITDPKPFVKPKPDRKAIKAAVGKAFSRAGLGA
jgi:hypothetical protein